MLEEIITIRIFRIEDLFTADTLFNREKVHKFISLGVDYILKTLDKDPAKYCKSIYKNIGYNELVDGQHRAIALYHLNQKTIKASLYDHGGEIFRKPKKLIRIPLVSDKTYREHYKMML